MEQPVDDLNQREIGRLIVASEELALRSATARHNMERASAQMAVLLDRIDAQHSAVLAILQAGADGYWQEVEPLAYAPDRQESTLVAPSIPGRG